VEAETPARSCKVPRNVRRRVFPLACARARAPRLPSANHMFAEYNYLLLRQHAGKSYDVIPRERRDASAISARESARLLPNGTEIEIRKFRRYFAENKRGGGVRIPAWHADLHVAALRG